MESQAELTKALGVRSRFSNDILENNIKLKEIAGLELETRKALVQTSITQGKSATDLTKNVLAQTKAFEFETGVAFEFRDILGQASKQAGVLGLTFTKYPEKLTKALMTTKAMGFELKQLDGMASSFLDFEGSISKEMEAQVLLGRDVNLTKAREAALNNDLVGLAKEITSEVGNSEQFLKLNRIQQEAIAEAVGMSRDTLADTLKQQEYYKRLGADNLKNAAAELKLLKEKGLTQEEISKKIGEDAYNYITQTSTAERLTELMNRIKTIFIEFVEKSGLLDFITKPEKIQGFITGLIERLAGAVNMIGSIIAGILETVGDIAGLFNSERGASLKGLASQVRAGSAAFAGGLQGAASTIGAATTPSISSTVQDKGLQKATATPSASSTVQAEGLQKTAATPSISSAVQDKGLQKAATTPSTSSAVQDKGLQGTAAASSIPSTVQDKGLQKAAATSSISSTVQDKGLQRTPNTANSVTVPTTSSTAQVGGLQGTTGTIGGIPAPSISSAAQAGAKTEPQPVYIPGPTAPGASSENTTTVYLMVDGEVIAKQVAVKSQSSPYYKSGR